MLGACTSTPLREYVPKIITPYRMDIQQGNFVTLDMVDKLQAGQTKDQVRFILGTPMLTDVFHQERWDFVFRSAKGWNSPEKRRLTVFFDKGEKLEKWEAVDVPKALDVAAPAPEEPPGFFRRLIGGSSTAATAGSAGSAAAVPEAAPAAAVPPPGAAAPVVTSTPAAVAAVTGVGNVVIASSEPVAPAPPLPVQAASADTGDKPGMFSRMFGWIKPGAAAAPAAAPAIAQAAAPAAAAAIAPAVAAAAIPPIATPVPAPAPAPVLAPVTAPIAAAAPTALAQAAPAPVAAAPAPTSAPATASPPAFSEPAAPVRAAVIAALEQWRQAWSSKNVAAYVASYEPQYKLTGLTHAEWQAQRADRIMRPASIRVAVSEIRMAQEGDGAVAVSFIQKYESPTFSESGRKLLVFGDYNGQWLIREESFLANSK